MNKINKQKNSRLISIFSRRIEIKFSSLKYFIEEMETCLIRAQKEFYKFLDSKLKDLDDNKQNEIIDIYYDDLYMKRDEFPKLLNYIFIMLIHTRLGTCLNIICKNHSYRNNLSHIKFGRGRRKRSVGDWYVLECLKYLEDHTSLTKIKSSNEGRMIIFLNKIRNEIVHNNGVVPYGNDLRKKIVSHRELKINERNEIEISDNYIKKRFTLLEKFLPKLAKKIYN
ncbi:MAG: hypothetical protein ACTSQG_10035 [Promethearchaeota archaeon]